MFRDARYNADMIKTLSATQLMELVERGEQVQLVDVRDPGEFADGHIPSAVNIPMDEAESRIEDLRQREQVVLICQGGARAEMTCGLLAPHHPNVLVLQGGTDAWQEAGLPVIRGRRIRLPLMRQVQVVVGPLALAGSLLAMLVNPLWAILPASIGAGLTIAGITGFCGMAKLLGFMPWNRARPATVRVHPA